ncbi:hypothetical protein BDZ91DRAFT_799695 [Kalaharituber pfeilii]|nr:hypothetical protein BDZ91DRAFT_799695 [Kalaharituber pfeilii]
MSSGDAKPAPRPPTPLNPLPPFPPTSHIAALARRLSSLPVELVHQIYDHLTLARILDLLCAVNPPDLSVPAPPQHYLDSCLVSHIQWGKILSVLPREAADFVPSDNGESSNVWEQHFPDTCLPEQLGDCIPGNLAPTNLQQNSNSDHPTPMHTPAPNFLTGIIAASACPHDPCAGGFGPEVVVPILKYIYQTYVTFTARFQRNPDARRVPRFVDALHFRDIPYFLNYPPPKQIYWWTPVEPICYHSSSFKPYRPPVSEYDFFFGPACYPPPDAPPRPGTTPEFLLPPDPCTSTAFGETLLLQPVLKLTHLIYVAYRNNANQLARMSAPARDIPPHLTSLRPFLRSHAILELVHAIVAAETRLQSIKSSQLRRMSALILRYPGLTRQRTDASASECGRPRSSELHLVRRMQDSARLLDRRGGRFSEIASKKLVCRFVFDDERQRPFLIPTNAALKGFVKVLKQWPVSSSPGQSVRKEEEGIGYVYPPAVKSKLEFVVSMLAVYVLRGHQLSAPPTSVSPPPPLPPQLLQLRPLLLSSKGKAPSGASRSNVRARGKYPAVTVPNPRTLYTPFSAPPFLTGRGRNQPRFVADDFPLTWRACSMLPFPEIEMQFLQAFLEICDFFESPAGMGGMRFGKGTGEGKGVTVGEWWARHVRGLWEERGRERERRGTIGGEEEAVGGGAATGAAA